MEPSLVFEPPALRLARLRFELACVNVRLGDERRRARRELDSPLTAPRAPCRAGCQGRLRSG